MKAKAKQGQGQGQDIGEIYLEYIFYTPVQQHHIYKQAWFIK